MRCFVWTPTHIAVGQKQQFNSHFQKEQKNHPIEMKAHKNTEQMANRSILNRSFFVRTVKTANIDGCFALWASSQFITSHRHIFFDSIWYLILIGAYQNQIKCELSLGMYFGKQADKSNVICTCSKNSNFLFESNDAQNNFFSFYTKSSRNIVSRTIVVVLRCNLGFLQQ